MEILFKLKKIFKQQQKFYILDFRFLLYFKFLDLDFF